jgi:heat shock protein HslJ
MKTSAPIAPLLMVVMVIVFLSCNRNHTKPPDDIVQEDWSLDALKNATYSGFSVHDGPVKLINGRWEGKPYVDGGASRPSVHFVDDFYRIGTVADHDAAIVFLAESTGGSGIRLYLAVVEKNGSALVNMSTTPVGDRVQIRDARIEEGTIAVDVLQAGPEDAACCPGELATRRWHLAGNRLAALETEGQVERFSIDIIAGTIWRLSHWNVEDAAPAEPAITLVYEDGQFAGSSGCNRYFASVKAGNNPGILEVGPAGTTRMLCPENIMAVEKRFLKQLNGVSKLGFMAGELALSYEFNGKLGCMRFGQEMKRRPKKLQQNQPSMHD